MLHQGEQQDFLFSLVLVPNRSSIHILRRMRRIDADIFRVHSKRVFEMSARLGSECSH